MCKKIFIAATGQHCGKTTISLSLMHLARKKYARVGFIKPIGPKLLVVDGVQMDMDAALIASMVHYRTYSIAEIKGFLHERGVKTRMHW